MSQSVTILDKTFKAGEDLDSYKNYAVYLSADQTVKLCTTSYVNAIGILKNEPKEDENAVVAVIGTVKAIAGEVIAVGKRVYVDTDGMIMEENTIAQTEVRMIGVALEASGADGDIIEILLIQESFTKGAS